MRGCAGRGDVDASRNTLPPPADATPGTRWAIRAIYEPAHIQTVAGVVTVQIGTYGRFVLTDEGWVHDNPG